MTGKHKRLLTGALLATVMLLTLSGCVQLLATLGKPTDSPAQGSMSFQDEEVLNLPDFDLSLKPPIIGASDTLAEKVVLIEHGIVAGDMVFI